MVEMFRTGTEWFGNQITITRGSISDITVVGVYHSLDPNVIPDVDDFTTVRLVDGTSTPPDELAETGKVDVLSLIGPRNGDVQLGPGDWQRFVLVQTETEDILRKIDVVTIL